MANPEHLSLLRQGVSAWNQYRTEHLNMHPDLSNVDLENASLCGANLTKGNLIGANLRNADLSGSYLSWADLGWSNLSGANLSGANLSEANLNYAVLSRVVLTDAILEKANLSYARLSKAMLETACLREADLRGASMVKANLKGANLIDANLKKANLRDATLSGAFLNMADLNEAKLQRAKLEQADLDGVDLRGAKLTGAILTGAILNRSILVGTDFSDADLTGCCVYGVSAWDVNLKNAKQGQLVIGDRKHAEITVDNLEVAQFVYLMLENEKIRDVINTVTSKAVLILGRFTKDRKAVLDEIRAELRKRKYLPILFDFPKSPNRNLTETIKTLAHMAKFIIADLTDAKSLPQELQAIVPGLAIPVQPIIHKSQEPYAMFESFAVYDWVLKLYEYPSPEKLLSELDKRVIFPAEKELQKMQRKLEKKLRR